MARVKFVKCARKDYPNQGIKKGDSYYMWQLYRQPLQRSLTPPKPGQLTSSSFMQEHYAILANIDSLSSLSIEDLKEQVEQIISEIEGMKDEQQSKLDNMPEHLQESSESGQLLQERVDAYENWQSELESIDLEFEFEEEPEEPESKEGGEDFQEKHEKWMKEHQKWEERKAEAEAEFIQEKIEEIQSTDSGI